MLDLIIRVFASFGVLCALAGAVLFGWIWAGWREDRRQSPQADFAKWEGEMLSHDRHSSGMDRLIDDLLGEEGDR